MIAADELASAAARAVFGQGTGPVAADIVEGAELAALALHHDQGIARNAGRHVAADVGELTLMGEKQPGAGENAAPFAFVLFGTAVKRGVEGFRGGVGLAHVVNLAGGWCPCEAGGGPLPLRCAIPNRESNEFETL